ncbi:hypothetical protein WOLCODRAFT_70974 [Wolfiporia cocos MD-104 SS10]|uniref:Uncharacterized protein n=1 Tax=Wolfiporia cocos (strain MD-104) TaxID=742152 RepID=A0A2H3JG58_WOLCO|nr:hypothetical protein WOLCODRAFT_70974 [Wolfiporia cocos MD-104 SS10]
MGKIVTPWPAHERDCYKLCLLIFAGSRPPNCLYQWITFGFCTLVNYSEELELANMYRHLFDQCTFQQLASAYASTTLLALFDHVGFQLEPKRLTHLEDVLSTPQSEVKSVWHLKRYVLCMEKLKLDSSVAIDYGFGNCQSPEETLELNELYRNLFQAQGITSFDPIRLHHAAMTGKTFEYVSKLTEFSNRQKRLFRRLLKNPHPSPAAA